MQLAALFSKWILILGSGGFLGKHLVSALRSAGVVFFEVRGHTDCDLRNYQAVLRRLRDISPDVIIHLAASPDRRSGFFRSSNDFINTVLCTVNVSLAARRIAPCLVVHVGSYKQYGKLPSPFKEDMVPRPCTMYGLAKHVSEVLLRVNRGNGLQSVCMRMGPVFGPGQSSRYLVARTIQSILRGTSASLEALDTLWDPIYVSDAIEAILLCASQRQAWGQTINFSGGVSYSPYQIVRLIVAAMDKEEMSVTPVPRSAVSWNCLGDITLAQTLLGWMPAVPIPTAIRLTVDSYRNTEHGTER